MNPNQVKVSIIIPHHGGLDILDECLSSLQKSIFQDYEIILVDNNSQDESVGKIKNKYPKIKVISLTENLGYAGGCNQGAMNSNGELLLFLNNDTIHDSNWIQPLVGLMDSDDTIGSIQPKVLNIKKRKLFDYAGGTGGFIDIFCFPFVKGRIFNHIETDKGQYDSQGELFWPSGCAFITRKDLFLKILFDTKLFAYMEEIDYAWKTILLGYKNLIAPQSIVYHDGGTFLSGNFLKSYLNHRNSMILFITNHNPIFMLLLIIPKMLLELASLLKYLLTFNLKGFIAQFCSYLWILSHPIYLIKRIYSINQIKKYPLYSILNKMYKSSIAFQYFILGKKSYSELTD